MGSLLHKSVETLEHGRSISRRCCLAAHGALNTDEWLAIEKQALSFVTLRCVQRDATCLLLDE